MKAYFEFTMSALCRVHVQMSHYVLTKTCTAIACSQCHF